jgi:hypothetical protein
MATTHQGFNPFKMQDPGLMGGARNGGDDGVDARLQSSYQGGGGGFRPGGPGDPANILQDIAKALWV